MGFEGNPEPFAREGAVLQANLSCDVALLLLSEEGSGKREEQKKSSRRAWETQSERAPSSRIGYTRSSEATTLLLLRRGLAAMQ